MLLVCMVLVVAIPGLSSSLIIEREMNAEHSMATTENILSLDSRISQCEEELEGHCDTLIMPTNYVPQI